MKILLSIAISLLAINVYSQGICGNNIDFEHGNISGWVINSGDINGVTLPCNSCPTSTNGISSITSATNSGTTWANGLDNCTGLPVVAPGGGNYSLALNNNTAGGKIQKIAKSFIITPTDTTLTFMYQVVLEDGGHPVTEQPYFSYFIYDSTAGAVISSSQLIANINNTSLSWQPSSACTGTYYLPWTTKIFNLGSVIGHTVSVNFIVSDCNQGGHFGYAYLDAQCNGSLTPCGWAAPATLCFVTTNDTLHNEIYFNHSSTITSHQGTIIYRKNTLGIWDSLSTVSITQPDKYIDASIIANQSYTYCVAATDSCHTPYGKSTPHSTIFLQGSNGTTGQINLSWNAYTGIPVSGYKIYRGPSLSSMALIGQVSSTTYSYTDMSPAVGNDYYKIAISAPANCTSNASHDTLIESNYILKNITCNNTISPPANLCFVTTDDSLHNEIYFDHSITGLKGTIIYRQNASSVWDSIGFVYASQADKFVDIIANPNQQSFIYCMEQVDSCGYHHGKTPAHTTILLQSNLGTGNQVNLSWNAYIGVPVNSYYIYRGSTPFSMTFLAQVSSSTLAYNDLNPLTGNVYYRICISAPTSCTSDAAHDSLAGSNYRGSLITGINTLNKEETVTLYPNPATNTLYISSSDELGEIKTYDALGQCVLYVQGKNKQEQLDISKLAAGFYFVEIHINQRTHIVKFFKD